MSSLVLFAQGLSGWQVGFIVIAGLVIFSLFSLFTKQYKRCPSNRVLVVYGKSGQARVPVTCIHGGAAFVVPLVQDFGWLNLEPMDIEVALKGVLPKGNIRVNVPSVFTVAIGTTPELMQNAAIRLLGLTSEEIQKRAEEIIIGQLRQGIASRGIEDINRDRDKFLESIKASLEPDLKEIGLVLINVNIADESGYVETMSGVTSAVERLLAAFDISPQQLVAHLLQEGKLNEGDREEIRRLLDDSSLSTRSAANPSH